MIRHITAPINTTIITAIAAIVLALPVYSLAAGGSSYYGEEDLVILSEAKATEVAKRAVEELLENSKEKLTRALASGKASEEAKISKAAARKKKEETLGYQATKITSIASKNHRRTTTVTISADGDIGEYDSFVLDSPARLVVDVWDIGSELSSRTVSIDIDSEYIERVRVGTHPGKVRLVFDSPLATIPKHSFSKANGALVVTFGNADYEYKAKEIKKPKKDQAPSSAAILNAISVCAKDAPKMTKKFTDETGYRLKRVSLKVRNPENKPDHYERRVLRDFERLKKKGLLTKTTIHKRVVDEDGGRYLRYIKPLVIHKPCLNCHGRASKIPVEVRKFISKTYPEDKATGYRLGDVRGAVSVRIPVK